VEKEEEEAFSLFGSYRVMPRRKACFSWRKTPLGASLLLEQIFTSKGANASLEFTI